MGIGIPIRYNRMERMTSASKYAPAEARMNRLCNGSLINRRARRFQLPDDVPGVRAMPRGT